MVLEIISVYFYRNKKLIFDNFNLKLKKSQIMILIGSNGAGKSTLFDIIVGILEPNNGIIKLDNIMIEELSAKKRKMFTYLPHKDSLKDNLTIEENLISWINISGNILNKDQINRSLEYYQLSELKKKFVANLSQGQRKKVLLTKLILAKTKLWLLDEPFNGLDADSIKKTKKLIENHAKNGGSTLLSNHLDLSIKNSKKIFLQPIKKSRDIVKFETWDDIR